jgi:hypothetical protein
VLALSISFQTRTGAQSVIFLDQRLAPTKVKIYFFYEFAHGRWVMKGNIFYYFDFCKSFSTRKKINFNVYDSSCWSWMIFSMRVRKCALQVAIIFFIRMLLLQWGVFIMFFYGVNRLNLCRKCFCVYKVNAYRV